MKKGGEDGARGCREMHIECWWGNLKESYHFEDLRVMRG